MRLLRREILSVPEVATTLWTLREFEFIMAREAISGALDFIGDNPEYRAGEEA